MASLIRYSRPFVAHFLRPTFTLTLLFTNFDVVIRAALLSLTTISCWDVASTTFDIAFSIASTSFILLDFILTVL